MFHARDFLIRQKIEVVCAFACGEPSIILQTEADKEVDLPVGHVDDLLDSALGLIVVGQERQFAGQFRIDGLFDKVEKRFRPPVPPAAVSSSISTCVTGIMFVNASP